MIEPEVYGVGVRELPDTTGDEVVRALASQRRVATGVASGLTLTLVAVVDAERLQQARLASTTATAAHPCRLVIVVRPEDDSGGREQPSRLDAEIVVDGRLGRAEAVFLYPHGRLAHHTESVVIPLLAPDVPVVTWWHGPPPERIAYDPLGVLAQRRITDVAQATQPLAALTVRADDYAPGDTDLSWTRATGWRSLLAGCLDTATAPVVAAEVCPHPPDLDQPTAALIRGWLQARLAIPTTSGDGAGTASVRLSLANGEQLSVSAKEGSARITRTGASERGEEAIPAQWHPLPHRDLGELLAEELRQLGPDMPYAGALAAATGRSGLDSRPARREHVWHDPSSPG